MEVPFGIRGPVVIGRIPRTGYDGEPGANRVGAIVRGATGRNPGRVAENPLRKTGALWNPPAGDEKPGRAPEKPTCEPEKPPREPEAPPWNPLRCAYAPQQSPASITATVASRFMNRFYACFKHWEEHLRFGKPCASDLVESGVCTLPGLNLLFPAHEWRKGSGGYT